MKIAIVYDVIYPYVKGGVEKRVWEIASRLSLRGHDVHLYGMKFWDGDDTYVQDGVTLHGVCPARNLYSYGRRTIWQALSFSIALFFCLRGEDYDIVDCQQFPYFSCIACSFMRTPLVITWHEVWGDYWYTYLGRTGFFGKCIEWWVSRLTVNTIAVSTTTAKNLMDLNGQSNIKIIGNGVDLKRIGEIVPHKETSDIIFVGRLIKEKNVDVLIRAMVNKNYRLLIIGNGPEWENLKYIISELSLESRARMIGFLDNYDEIIAHMKSSRVCVLPSTREGFGIAALEAMACGLPVVTVDHLGNAIRDLITEETGFLCSLSEKDIADKIGIAIGRCDEMMGCMDQFDWDDVAREVEGCYAGVIRTHTTNP